MRSSARTGDEQIRLGGSWAPAGVARLLGALLALAVLTVSGRALAGDPYLRWYTVETPRFRVHYHSGLAEHAQEVATLAETVHRRLSPQLAWQPKEVTHIVLTDDTDSANGSATVQPYNLIRMFVTAPDDMSVLNDYDDWNLELLTHEHVHILHLDNRSGLPSLLNGLFGKTYTPNAVQPRWILEGLAVALESQHTSAGRVRSTLFDMYLRADVLENNFASLDQLSHSPRRWPSGNLWYLYGGKFISWIQDTYGQDTFAKVSTDYGSNLLAWGLNRSIRRATGSTYPQLYRAWQGHLKRRYGRLVARLKKRGLREGVRLTHSGRIASTPRFAPACARAGKEEEIYYFRAGPHAAQGIYRLPLERRDRAREGDRELVSRTSNIRGMDFDPQCNLVFDTSAPSRRRYRFRDLFRQPRGTRSPRGLSTSLERLTIGERASAPTVSPDGRLVAYVTNSKGTTTLRIADITPDGRMRRRRRLARSARFDQAFTPRFSPDGRHVAFGVWTRGGYRDIRIVNVKTGKLWRLTKDRAIDQQPTWSPNGKTLLYTSDRTGIANIYAYDLRTKKTHQVTNVVNGAYMPEVTPDGKTLFYMGYTSEGFDLFSMKLDRSRWLKASTTRPAPRPSTPPKPKPRRWKVVPYSPLPTLRPTRYEAEYGDSSFGPALLLTTSGSDAIGLHAFSASVTAETSHAEPTASIDYAFRGLPFTMSLGAFSRALPRGGFRTGDEDLLVTERVTGLRSGLSYAIPGRLESQNIQLTYTAAHFDQELPFNDEPDPFATVTRAPSSGFLGTVRLGYSFSNVESYPYSISSERGFSVGLAGDIASPETGSEWTLASINGRVVAYTPMPWADHHVLATALSSGAATGTYPRRGQFGTGGFIDTPAFDAYTDDVFQSQFLLRGYDPGQFRGNLFNLLNVEYRYPVWYADQGVSTLPVFLRTISGALWADYGGAFNTVDLDRPLDVYQASLGAEFWFEITLGYGATATLRLGYAHGLDSEAPSPSTYFVAQSVF